MMFKRCVNPSLYKLFSQHFVCLDDCGNKVFRVVFNDNNDGNDKVYFLFGETLVLIYSISTP